MKTSYCQCGNRIFFENTQCQSCKSELGFLSDEGILSSITSIDANHWQSTTNNHTYRKCKNYVDHTGCNWMIADGDPQHFCPSCRLSEIIPDLNKAENIVRWNRIERAKRRLIYTLFWLELPIKDKTVDPQNGLAFHLMEDQIHYSEFAAFLPEHSRITTGHVGGVITLNIEEADPVVREEIRKQMQERYRTLLGHLRHESGHYYWSKVVNSAELVNEFKSLFGDHQADYSNALQRYYDNGPDSNWQTNYISAYACAHPMEDWAECWAHYLHMIDTMETAYDFETPISANEIIKNGQRFNKNFLASVEIKELIDHWSYLSMSLNEMNRSMGLADAYPFFISSIVTKKIAFIHKVITCR